MLGGRIADRLRDRGVPFRALVRQESPGFADSVVGDLRDRASLDRALEGVDTVITTVTAIGRLLSGSQKGSLLATDEAGTANLIDAAEQAGVERFVYLSATGIEDNPAMPFARGKLASERRLHSSRLREVIVRPEAFQEIWISPTAGLDWESGKLKIFGRGESKVPYVAVDDVAEATVRLALADDPPRIVEFGGPEAVSRKQLCDAIERVTGRPMKRSHVPRLVLRVASRALAPVKPAVASLMALALRMDTKDSSIDAAALIALGVEPRSASAYVEQAVPAQR